MKLFVTAATLYALLPLGGGVFLRRSHEDSLCHTPLNFQSLFQTAAEAQREHLTTNEDIPVRIGNIVNSYHHTFGTTSPESGITINGGRLIKESSDGEGILDIDKPLKMTMCAKIGKDCSTETKIRDEIVNTVKNDLLVRAGNEDASKIGLTNLNKVLMGVRVGNTASENKVILVSQMHGNEPGGTEAFLDYLEHLVSNTGSGSFLADVDLLFLIRVNMDGGDPRGNNLDGNAYLDYLMTSPAPLIDPTSTYFFRQNVDVGAGGGFARSTESDFNGVVGRGYDINRYIHVGLDKAIRPVESQAVVAALHAFEPKYVYDAHGDVQKATCDFPDGDPPASFPLGEDQIPVGICAGFPLVPTLAKGRSSMVEVSVGVAPGIPEVEQVGRKLAGYVAGSLEGEIEGKVHRFSQVSLDLEPLLQVFFPLPLPVLVLWAT